MEENNKPKKRRIPLPATRTDDTLEVTVMPTLDRLMSDAMGIIGHQLAHFKSRLNRSPNMVLEAKDAKCVQAYMEALIKLSRENREMAKQYDFTEMTDEELEQEIQKLKDLQK